MLSNYDNYSEINHPSRGYDEMVHIAKLFINIQTEHKPSYDVMWLCTT